MLVLLPFIYVNNVGLFKQWNKPPSHAVEGNQSFKELFYSRAGVLNLFMVRANMKNDL